MFIFKASIVVSIVQLIVGLMGSEYYEYVYNETAVFQNQEDLLIYRVFTQDGYNNEAIPVKNSSKAVLVSMYFALFSLLELDEQAQTFSTYGRLEMNWVDELITWNIDDFQGVTSISLPASDVWVPNIAISNSAKELYGDILDPSKFKLQILPDGSVDFATSGSMITPCLLDVTYFPFDSQACYIELTSWLLDDSRVVLSNRLDKVDMKFYRINSQWDMAATKTTNVTRDNDKSTIRLYFYLTRKPAYFLVSLVIPCVAITVLIVFVFVVPNDAGERNSLQVTLLLSFTVFQFSLAGSLPKTSDSIPIISIYLFTGMALSALALVIAALIQRVNYIVDQAVPKWLRHVTFDILDKLFGIRLITDILTSAPETSFNLNSGTLALTNESRRTSGINSSFRKGSLRSGTGLDDMESNPVTFLGGYHPGVKEEHNDDLDEDLKNLEEFADVGRICDRLFFFIFTIVVVAITVWMFASFYRAKGSLVEPLEE